MATFIEQYANAAASTLSGAITAGATSMAVTSGSLYPPIPQFRTQVESEYILVTGVTGNVWTVVRGVEGSTPAAHASGATVTHILTAAGLAGICGQTVLTGPTASLPATGVFGREYFPTDGVHIYQEGPGGWTPWGRVNQLTLPPASGAFTPINVTTAALSGAAGTLFINAPNIAASHGQFWMKPLASGAYTWTVNLESILFDATDCECGIALRDTGTGKIISLENQANAGLLLLHVVQWTDANTRTATGVQLTNRGAPFPWFRIVDDGTTNRAYWISRDGINWMNILTEARTTWLGVAPNQAGIFAASDGAAVGLGIYSWSGV